MQHQNVCKSSIFADASFHQKLYWASFSSFIILPCITCIKPLPLIIQMFISTGSILYVGAHLSLLQLSIDPETGKKEATPETVKQRDAWMFPVFGSVVLFSLYLAYKFLSPYWVNILLAAYLLLFGGVATSESINLVMSKLIPYGSFSLMDCTFRFPPMIYTEETVHFNITVSRVISLIVAAALSLTWLMTKNWAPHNLLAIAFCLQALQMISINNFKIALTLLVGLFFYDIFWVFATDVMTTVAKMFDAPAKLIFPVSLNPWKQSILGLGDVVIPGMFIAMILRFDHHLHSQSELGSSKTKMLSKQINIHKNFPKFYFWCNMFMYQCGLLCAGFAVHIFKRPQPALLYLVPANLCGLLLPALVYGDYHAILAYNEGSETESSSEKTTNASTAGPLPNKEPGKTE